MSYENGIAFQTAMDGATHLHIAGDYQGALEVRERAHTQLTGHDFTLDGDIAQASLRTIPDSYLQSNATGNFRNIAATYERLGRDGEAEAAIAIALENHARLTDVLDDKPYILRELGADQLYVGAFALKKALWQELSSKEKLTPEAQRRMGSTALQSMRLSRASFEEAREAEAPSRPPHQYELNAMRRFSMVESLYGNPSDGLKLGMQALRWAFTSEPERTVWDRSRAVLKAGAGAVGAVGVNLLSRIGLRQASVVATQKLL